MAFLYGPAPASAGTFSCGGSACTSSFAGATYSSAKCPAPEVPVMQTNSSANYNASVQKANDYVAAVKKQLDCLTEEANGDQKDIGAALRDGLKHAQDDSQANLDKLSAALKNAPKTVMGSGSAAPSTTSRY